MSVAACMIQRLTIVCVVKARVGPPREHRNMSCCTGRIHDTAYLERKPSSLLTPPLKHIQLVFGRRVLKRGLCVFEGQARFEPPVEGFDMAGARSAVNGFNDGM